ncbi:LPXTG cell wall anchor domain-containing protein [Streptomyces vinaceus]|uniref:LPXTG cell wall anchor domain-containing protein n=1 Tax=Streptomyces vinaceus TaxID=1960 RepID=UPI0036C602C4
MPAAETWQATTMSQVGPEAGAGGDSTALLLGAGGLVLAGGGALALARRSRRRA